MVVGTFLNKKRWGLLRVTLLILLSLLLLFLASLLHPGIRNRVFETNGRDGEKKIEDGGPFFSGIDEMLPQDYTRVCTPTSGDCIAPSEGFQKLQEALNHAQPNEVVALCRSNDTFWLDTTLTIQDPRNLKLCCATDPEGIAGDIYASSSSDAETCNLQIQSGKDRILEVTGKGDFTLLGIELVNGFGKDDGDDYWEWFGGNLIVHVTGDVIIDQCVLDGGTNGGSTHIGTPQKVTLRESVFRNSQDSLSGAAALDGALHVLVEDCTFQDNRGGAGLYLARTENDGATPSLTILNSEFKNNSDNGGFMATWFGSFPKLTVLLTEFDGNTGNEDYGGAGSAFYVDQIVMDSNIGGGNHGGKSQNNAACNDFTFYGEKMGDTCASLGDQLHVSNGN